MQEFDLKVVYKLGHVHFVPNLFRINHGKSTIKVKDHLPNGHLFLVNVEWYGPIIE